MLEKVLRRSVQFLMVLCGVVLFLFVLPRVSDKEAYGKLCSRQELASVSTLKSSDQKRKGVRKDAFLVQADGSRLHHRIDSASSTLFLVPNQGKFDIVEDLQNIHCMIQEKVVSVPTFSQQMKFLRAEEGKWSYAKQEFAAKSVTLSLLKLPGKELPASVNEKEAFLKGLASGVSFSLSGEKPNFHAEEFKALLKSKDSP